MAVKIEDTWRVTEIDNARLGEGTSHGHERIGADREPSLSPIALAVVNDRMKSVVRGSRRVRTSGGLIVELRQVEQGTRFVVTPRGGTAKILWSTGLENCHSLALSPDERYMAFQCELNGLIVTLL